MNYSHIPPKVLSQNAEYTIERSHYFQKQLHIVYSIFSTHY